MNIDSPFEQWRLKHMRGTAASKDIMELLALAFEGGRAVSKPKEWQSLTDEERYLNDCRSEEEIEYARAIEKLLREKNHD